MDFTIKIYHKLLTSLQARGYALQPFANFMERPAEKAIILRHDVDKLPVNALKMAHLEHGLGICGTYYFRVVKESWDDVNRNQKCSDFGKIDCSDFGNSPCSKNGNKRNK